MLQAARIPRLAGPVALKHCRGANSRAFASSSAQTMHSLTDADAIIPPVPALEEAGSSQAVDASSASTSPAQHAFKGASAERRRRLRELSSPIYAPDMERKDMIDRIVRVDHSGEYSAVQIYRGQVCISRFDRVSVATYLYSRSSLSCKELQSIR